MLKKSIVLLVVVGGVVGITAYLLRTDEQSLRNNLMDTDRNEFQETDDRHKTTPENLSGASQENIGTPLETLRPESMEGQNLDDSQDVPISTKDKYEEYLKKADLSMPEGLDLSQEKFIGLMDDLLRLDGLSPPERPYWARLKEIHKMVEERGYKREELFDFYSPILRHMGENTLEYLQQAKKTHELAMLFKNNQWKEIEQWVQKRLQENMHDIPALLVQMELHYSPHTANEFFDDIENFVIGLDNFAPTGVDKRALLYDVLRSGMFWGSITVDQLKRAREKPIRTHPGAMSPGLAEFLCRLEIAGDW